MQTEILVVKIGGAAGIDPTEVCVEISALQREGYQVIVVHGGSERANRLGMQLGHPPQFITSPSGHLSRYTDAHAREIFVRATTELNHEIVQKLMGCGVSANGLAGLGRCVIYGRRKTALRAQENGRVRIIRDDYSGRICGVNAIDLWRMLANDHVPVIPPVAWDADDGLLNIDGDRCAAAVASAMGAREMILLSNVPGLMRAFPDERSLVPQVQRRDLAQAMLWAQGRMKRKVLSVSEALEGGVGRVGLADGRVQQPLRNALAGGGTWFG